MTATLCSTETEHEGRLVEAVIDAHQTLVMNGPDPRIIERILARVGCAAGVDRAYIFELRSDRHGSILGSQRYEWSADSTEPQISNPELQDVPMREAGFGRWIDRFLAYLPVAGRIREFPKPERRLLEQQSIRSLIVLPIYADAVLWGFVGFDDCASERVWSDMEVDMLLSIAISLGAVLIERRGRAPGAVGSTSNSRIAGYAAIAGGLLWAPDRALRAHGADHFSASVIETRMRTLVRTHQFLRSRSADDAIALDEYLHDLQDSLHLITSEIGIRTIVAPPHQRHTLVQPHVIPAIGILVAERLACLMPAPEDANTLHYFRIEVKPRDRTAVVVIQGFDADSNPRRATLDTTAARMLFERRLLSHAGGEIRGPRSGVSSEVGTFPTV